ncbi:MAG: hypothetical protein JNK67_23905 [Alphaproteobacteria bacterium]|nr:hypothetical protein [Alphaproteobacteria bacterium]
MEVTSLEPRFPREADLRLLRAVELLEAIDRRVADVLRVEAVQDIVGTLLLVLARLRTDGTRAPNSAMSSAAEIEDLIRACVVMAGVPDGEVEFAVSAAAIIEGSVRLPRSAASERQASDSASNVVFIGRGQSQR